MTQDPTSTSITLYPEDRLILNRVAAAKNIRSLSGVVRFVLREWANLSGYYTWPNYEETEPSEEVPA